MRTIIIVITALYILSIAAPLYSDSPISKFSRGLCNVVTFPFEITEQSKRVKKEHGSVAGMTYGLCKGIFMAVTRAVVGVYEIGTFPIPYPKDYAPILTDPISFFPEPKPKGSIE